jgi:hypothetical protein
MFGRNKHKTLHKKLGASQHSGSGVPYHQAYGYRSLPGAGANQWAWLTQLLPTYPAAGLGVPNGANDPALPEETVINGGQIVHSPSGIVMSAIQGAVLYALGDPGILTGQFVLQPLTDTSPAAENWYLAESPISEGMQMSAGG